jgi:hypothetical protein
MFSMDFDNVRSIAVLVLTILLAATYLLTSRRRAPKLGVPPPQVPYYLPFGFGILWEAIKVVQLSKPR